MLITINEAKTLARPINAKVSDDKILAYIRECESQYIKVALGDDLYNDLRVASPSGYDDKQLLLMNGGTYTNKCGKTRIFDGLKVALAYYVYAKNVMSGDVESTRYGMVVKEDTYSSHINNKDRATCYNEALQVADSYLADCVVYAKSVDLIECGASRTASSGSVTIRKI